MLPTRSWATLVALLTTRGSRRNAVDFEEASGPAGSSSSRGPPALVVKGRGGAGVRVKGHRLCGRCKRCHKGAHSPGGPAVARISVTRWHRREDGAGGRAWIPRVCTGTSGIWTVLSTHTIRVYTRWLVAVSLPCSDRVDTYADRSSPLRERVQRGAPPTQYTVHSTQSTCTAHTTWRS